METLQQMKTDENTDDGRHDKCFQCKKGGEHRDYISQALCLGKQARVLPSPLGQQFASHIIKERN